MHLTNFGVCYLSMNVLFGRSDIMNNKDIWVMLENVKFNIKLGKDAKNPDKKYYQNLIDGKKTNNINKLYKFITALEKSGIVPHNSELIELINWKAHP